MTVAALYVETKGCYSGLSGVDPWDMARDARLYHGPNPVVAHPPCPRWGKMWFGQPLTVKTKGTRKLLGDDAGCFPRALWAVRTFGGILEHPWQSQAWPYFGLTVPDRRGGWIKADKYGGWTCCVEQRPYGHHARKPTLLYAVGCELPDLVWGKTEAQFDEDKVKEKGIKWCRKLGEVGMKGGGVNSHGRNYTPPAFRDLLISIASTARPALAVAAE